MNWKPFISGILALSMAASLTACGFLGAEYRRVTPHTPPHVDVTGSHLQISDSEELLRQLISAAEQRKRNVEFSLLWANDGAETLIDNTLERLRQTEVGSYKLRSVNYTCEFVDSYYECTVSFHYRQNAIDTIVDCLDYNTAYAAMEKAVTDFDTILAIRMPNELASEEALQDMLREVYYSHVTSALGFPARSVRFYPAVRGSGGTCIAEVQLQWDAQADALTVQSEAAQTRAARMADGCGTNRKGAWTLYERVLELADYDAENGASGIDGVFINGRANDEGMAVAYQLLCELVGLEGEVCQGTRNGEPAFWNQVTLGGRIYLLDLTRAEEESVFLYTPEAWRQLGYERVD